MYKTLYYNNMAAIVLHNHFLTIYNTGMPLHAVFLQKFATKQNNNKMS